MSFFFQFVCWMDTSCGFMVSGVSLMFSPLSNGVYVLETTQCSIKPGRNSTKAKQSSLAKLKEQTHIICDCNIPKERLLGTTFKDCMKQDSFRTIFCSSLTAVVHPLLDGQRPAGLGERLLALGKTIACRRWSYLPAGSHGCSAVLSEENEDV